MCSPNARIHVHHMYITCTACGYKPTDSCSRFGYSLPLLQAADRYNIHSQLEHCEYCACVHVCTLIHVMFVVCVY